MHLFKGITRNENHDRSTSGDEEHTPLWYIMDEFGSCIKHSDDPSFAVAMLFYVPLGVSFSIMWPLRDMAYGGLDKNNEDNFDLFYIYTEILLREKAFWILLYPMRGEMSFLPVKKSFRPNTNHGLSELCLGGHCG